MALRIFAQARRPLNVLPRFTPFHRRRFTTTKTLREERVNAKESPSTEEKIKTDSNNFTKRENDDLIKGAFWVGAVLGEVTSVGDTGSARIDLRLVC